MNNLQFNVVEYPNLSPITTHTTYFRFQFGDKSSTRLVFGWMNKTKLEAAHAGISPGEHLYENELRILRRLKIQ